MGTLYSGVAASLTTGVQITVPADGDTDNAVTFDVGLQKLADYVEALRQPRAFLSSLRFDVLAGDTPAALTLGAATKFNGFTVGRAVTLGTGFTNDGTGKITVGAAGTYRIAGTMYAQSVSTSVSVQLQLVCRKNGSQAGSFGQQQITGASGANGAVTPGDVMLLVLAANDFIELYYSAQTSAGALNVQAASLIVERVA